MGLSTKSKLPMLYIVTDQKLVTGGMSLAGRVSTIGFDPTSGWPSGPTDRFA